MTNLGRRWFPPELKEIKLAAYTDSIWFRQGLTDLLVLQHLLLEEEYRAVHSLCLPSDARIMDLGANIGLASRYFAAHFPEASFLVVEPDDANLKVLVRNCEHLISTGRLTMRKAFAGGNSGMAALDRSSGEPLGFKKVAGRSTG
jgi:hypothetical protein